VFYLKKDTNHHDREISGLVLMEPGGLAWDDIVDYIIRTQIPDTVPQEQPNEANKTIMIY